MAKPIPEGTHSVTPHLVVKGATRAIEFYKRAFGARFLYSMPMPDGRLGHAEIRIGDSPVYLADEFPDWGGARSPAGLESGSPVTIHLYVENCDAVFDQAVKAGARVKQPLMDAFWGDRYGQVVDPFGHAWSIATHKEDLTPEEMAKRGQAAMAAMPPPQPAKKKPAAKRKAPRAKKAGRAKARRGRAKK